MPESASFHNQVEIAVCSLHLGPVALPGESANGAEMSQGPDGFVHYDSTMIRGLLKLGGRVSAR